MPTGLPRATAHRLAVALEVHGLVRRDESGRFVLGLRLIELGRAAAAGFPLAEVARPVLERLRDRTAEGVQLYVREGEHHRRCVLSLPAPHGLQWIVPEGVLLPLDRGSAGRVLVGDAIGVDPAVGRERGGTGEGRGVGECPGPLGRRQVVAAISVSGPLERLTRSPGKRFGPLVLDAAADLARRLTA